MSKTYTATTQASSRQAQDWGRAMAQSMKSLAAQVSAEDAENVHEQFFGQDLLLHIAEAGEMVEITLTWTPQTPPTPQAPTAAQPSAAPLTEQATAPEQTTAPE